MHKSLENIGVECIDLIQFHTWEDSWLEDARWMHTIDDFRRQGLIKAVGISINRWEPWNGIKTVQSGLIDSVQVIYNIFDQNPEDELFPACEEKDVAVISRVPFDEGTLTGILTKETTWPEGDWRNSYFVPENLISSVERADALKPLVPEGMSMADMALRFILNNPTVSTIIPGMRKLNHVEQNLAISRYSLRTRSVPVKGGGLRVGAVGRITYTNLDQDQHQHWMRQMQALAAFAIFSGVGAGTSMGLGQCRMVYREAEKRQRS